MAEPNPTEVAPWYLRNITQALELNSATGQVFVRTNAAIVGNVSIGNVAIGSLGNVDISGNTLPVTVSSGNVTVYQGTNPWVITGNTNVAITSGNVGITGNLAGITSNVTVVDGGGSITVDGTVNANVTGGNVAISSFGNGLKDAFGRLRVSNPVTIFDTQARYYDHEQFSSSITGAANVVYNANSSSFLCSVGTASGDQVLRETVRTFTYQPGKSLLIYQSFCMNEAKVNLRQRVGYFGAQNGIYFEVTGTDLYMVIRSYSSGAIVEDRVLQANWNIDTLSGSGGASNPSGIELDVALDQIWFCDIEWLGSGTVRVGFIIDGNYVECHHFHHANTPSTAFVNNTTTYMTTATLPLRLEITNTGTTASPSSLRQICSSVISEGGYQLLGNPRAAAHLIGTPRRLPNDVSFVPVIAIRLKPTMLDAVVVPINYSIVPLAQSFFQFRVYKYAVTSGGTWVDSAADSAVQYNLAPTALVSGDIVEQSFINSTNQSASAPTQEGFSFVYQLEREPFTGVPYEYVITMATTGQNQDIYASIEWQEMT